MRVSEKTNIAMPIKNLISIIAAVAIGKDEVNLNDIYIKFGCTKVKKEKGISL